MNQPLNITEKEFHDYMEFCIDMCDRNRVVWRIEREDGKAVMCVPVVKEVAIEPEVQEQLLEFQKQFMEENAS